jgi:hypothetical protein
MTTLLRTATTTGDGVAAGATASRNQTIVSGVCINHYRVCHRIVGLLLAALAVLALTTINMFASGDSSPLSKLDPQIVLALKQSRGQPPFDKPTSLQPDIPIKDPGRILVELDATVSKQLLDQIVLIGGQVWSSAESSHTICAMVPLAALEGLAARPDIKSIAPARLYDTSQAKGSAAERSGIPPSRP